MEPRDDAGFTLIELLVVIVILGILAAIAIPVFLSQREKGWDAAVRSDLRNAATAQLDYVAVTDSPAFADDIALLAPTSRFRPSLDVVFDVVEADTDRFCMVAHHLRGRPGRYWYFDSEMGYPIPVPTAVGICPVL